MEADRDPWAEFNARKRLALANQTAPPARTQLFSTTKQDQDYQQRAADDDSSETQPPRTTKQDQYRRQYPFETPRRSTRVPVGPYNDNYNHVALFDIERYYWKFPTCDTNTLQGSLESPNTLVYILLYNGVHPCWRTENKIFTTMNLRLLPEYAANKQKLCAAVPKKDQSENHNDDSDWVFVEGPAKLDEDTGKGAQGGSKSEAATAETLDIPPVRYEPSSAALIAIFEQPYKPHVINTGFEFAGWYTIKDIELLAPRSTALANMIAQKFSTVRDHRGVVTERQRSGAAWDNFLGSECAVIQFKPVVGQGAPMPPKIKKHDPGRMGYPPPLPAWRLAMSELKTEPKLGPKPQPKLELEWRLEREPEQDQDLLW